MRRFCSGIAGVVLAFTLAGCGESAPEGPLPSTAASTDAIDKLQNAMSENMKKGAFSKKQVDTKPADKAPADIKPADKKE